VRRQAQGNATDALTFYELALSANSESAAAIDGHRRALNMLNKVADSEDEDENAGDAGDGDAQDDEQDEG
jgi:hypothetical protein